MGGKLGRQPGIAGERLRIPGWGVWTSFEGKWEPWKIFECCTKGDQNCFRKTMLMTIPKSRKECVKALPLSLAFWFSCGCHCFQWQGRRWLYLTLKGEGGCSRSVCSSHSLALAAEGLPLHPFLGIAFSLKVSVPPSMTGWYRSYKGLRPASKWKRILKDPLRSSEASLFPGAHSHKIPTHTSRSQSLLAGSGLNARVLFPSSICIDLSSGWLVSGTCHLFLIGS